jgi:NAD dependent epimerase/dehydratase family enzyme
MHRPAIVPAPAFALEFALGEMAEALLLASQRVMPSRLQQLGYKFLHADLPSALGAVVSDA